MTRLELEGKFDAMFKQLNGYSIDWDGVYKAQCYDLIQEWNVNWLGGKFLSGGYAYQLAGKNPEQYIWIPNSSTAYPIKGDILVWDNGYNNAGGHTGVATGRGNTVGSPLDWFECFEQNDPTGSVCHLKNYSYAHVVGWLRFKTTEPTPQPQNYQQMIDQIRTLQSLPSDQFKAKVLQIIKG